MLKTSPNRPSELTRLELRSGIWYEDRVIELTFPPEWEIQTHWPDTPEPLKEAQIRAALHCEEFLHQLRDKRVVSIVVDDTSRPTPAFKVLPQLLQLVKGTATQLERLTIVVAAGTHGRQDSTALKNKLGAAAWQHAHIESHDDLRHIRYIGKTSYQTPVYVNRTLLASDLLIGLGGVYPQHTTGFGGGGKLAIGVCGRQTIMALHHKHGSMEGRYDTNNSFRKDVSEIAEMIGLNYSASLHIDAHLNIVNIHFGRHAEYYEQAARFSKDRYTAPPATGADLVIANAYPLDTSFTFMRKGYKPLSTAPKEAVKVMIVAAREGVGVHGLFQHIAPSPLTRLRNAYLKARSMSVRELLRKAAGRVTRKLYKPVKRPPDKERTTILPPNTEHLYVWRTDTAANAIHNIDDVTVEDDWDDLLGLIARRHFSDDKPVRVCVYPCAPIQCIDVE